MCSISTPQLHCPGQPQTSILSRNSSEMPNLIKKKARPKFPFVAGGSREGKQVVDRMLADGWLAKF